MRIALLILFIIPTIESYSQKEMNNQLILSGGFGKEAASIYGSYFHTWKLGKQKKFEVGLGMRLTSYFSKDKYYTSAPASLAGNDDNVDSLYVSNPQTNSFNLATYLAYHFTPRFSAGFDIDALGLSFGGKQNATYLAEGASLAASAKPTALNILLVGNNDRGMLNSEFFAQYKLNGHIHLRMAFQYLFTEYTTTSKVQQQPESNDRFRHKSGMISMGVSYLF